MSASFRSVNECIVTTSTITASTALTAERTAVPTGTSVTVSMFLSQTNTFCGMYVTCI